MTKRESIIQSENRPLLPKDPSILNEVDRERENQILTNSPEEKLTETPLEVAAVIPETDDPSTPCLTLRSFVIGTFFVVILAFINMFFYYRTNPITVSGLVAQLLAYPIGKLWARFMPKKKLKIFGSELDLNPGEFSVKEHVIITTMANASWQSAAIVDVYTIKRVFYGRNTPMVWAVLMVISSQLLGFGMAGVVRRFLVWPPSMIWPANLVNAAVFRALHDEEGGNKRVLTPRLKFFIIAFGCSFFWYFLPGFLFPALTAFSIVCAFRPNNVVLSQITGTWGMGLGNLMFDWSSITGFLFSPIIVPWWAICNLAFGFIFLIWIVTPLMYYNNVWGAKNYPIVTARLFTPNGHPFNVTRYLTSDLRLNITSYEAEGPMRMSPFFAFTYGIAFAGLTSILVYTILHEGPKIVKQFKSSIGQSGDIHAKLMGVYKEAPEWWYSIVFFSSLVLASVACHVTDVLPFYWVWISVIIPAVFMIPTGIVQALTNQSIGLNVISEFIGGFFLAGNPIGVMTFKVYGYMAQFQGLLLVSDLKLGHYMKIPPRVMFLTQIFATVLGGAVNLFTAHWLLTTKPDICTGRDESWNCSNTRTFFSSSVIWGLIGPVRVFGPSSIYYPCLFMFIVGIFIPIPVWLLLKKYPNSWLKHVHIPLMLNATSNLPPAPAGAYPMWVLIGFIFNFVIKRVKTDWWKKYSYVFSAAMDSGVAVCGILIFFLLTNNGISMPQWWGSLSTSQDLCPLSLGNFNGTVYS